jgi:hypothetical protein
MSLNLKIKKNKFGLSFRCVHCVKVKEDIEASYKEALNRNKIMM